MFDYLRSIFHPPTAASIALEQLQDAERMLLLHTAEAEHHDAQALMFQARIERLGHLRQDSPTALFTAYNQSREQGLGPVGALRDARREA